MSNILDHFIGTPWPLQKEMLKKIESYWTQYDTFILNLPVASGKSYIAACIAAWSKSARILTPTNILVDQYKKDFEQFDYIKSALQYDCKYFGKCGFAPKHKGKRSYCGDCDYKCDYKKATASNTTVSTTHMLLALRSPKRLHIFDEAHNLLPILSDLHGSGYWPHKIDYPEAKIGSFSYLKWWADRNKNNNPAAAFIYDNLSDHPEYIFEWVQASWSGGGYVYNKKTIRSEPILAPYLRATPVDLRSKPDRLWRRGQKIILMSATIGRKDVEGMGLDRRKPIYIEGRSPIPRERRPIILNFVASVNYKNLEESADKIANRINQLLLEHKDKGLIHATYGLAELLKARLSSDRIIYHNRTNTSEKLKEFKASENKVFIASGLYEGVSLDYELAGWQVVCKVPWPSLANPGIKFKAEKDEEYYAWETIKPLLQASGRVCRRPDDYGVTYILDGSFRRVMNNKHLMPTWFTESLESTG